MRLLVKPVGAADVQPGGALRSDRRPAEATCASSINHEDRPRARRESPSLQHISLPSYFNCNMAETILEYWHRLLNQREPLKKLMVLLQYWNDAAVLIELNQRSVVPTRPVD